MNDEIKRREYDLIYPSIKNNRANPQSAQIPRFHAAPASHSEAGNEIAQISALQKQKEERNARWRVKRFSFEVSISELHRSSRELERNIIDLVSIEAAEKAEEARKNSWGTWLLSPLYNQRVESEEERARKDRGRQERMIEKDLKKRRLWMQESETRTHESQVRKGDMAIDAENIRDDKNIQYLADRKLAREAREQQEKWIAEVERRMKIKKQQQEQRDRELREAKQHLGKLEVEARAAESLFQQETRRLQQRFGNDLDSCLGNGATLQSHTSDCSHAGWWSEVHGRTTCPRCCNIRTYLLQCPRCQTKACPTCRSDLLLKSPNSYGHSYDSFYY